MKAILFAATSQTELSRIFYQDKLGLEFIEDSPFALVFKIQDTLLRVQKVEKACPPPYTSLGFQVTDVTSTVEKLKDENIAFEHYDFLEQDKLGIWTTPDGARIAWCKDPDGNLVSFSQHP